MKWLLCTFNTMQYIYILHICVISLLNLDEGKQPDK